MLLLRAPGHAVGSKTLLLLGHHLHHHHHVVLHHGCLHHLVGHLRLAAAAWRTTRYLLKSHGLPLLKLRGELSPFRRVGSLPRAEGMICLLCLRHLCVRHLMFPMLQTRTPCYSSLTHFRHSTQHVWHMEQACLVAYLGKSRDGSYLS